MLTCPKCSTSWPEEVTHCFRCGTALEPFADAQVEEPREVQQTGDDAGAPGDSKAPVAAGSEEQGEVLRALLICDLVGSTALVETLGDRRAAELGARHDRVARDLLARHGGREIDKTDGFLLLFERPIQALSFALDYHEELAGLSNEEGRELKARTGIHFGEVWLRENPLEDVRRGAKPIEVDGLAKVVAARLMSIGEGGQTLLSAAAFNLARRSAVGLDGSEDLVWLDHGTWDLHGVADPVDVYEVGREGRAPLRAPLESEKVHRLVKQPRVEGWRPAPGLTVPARPHWQVEERLGEGGFGEAWLARHTKTDELRSFKFCFDAERLRALQREITVFRLLKEELGDRPDINRILDWNLDKAPYFIESEYTRAGDLKQWSEAEGGLEKVPLATRLEIVAQVADALAAAHSVGVLHKDIKPSNILIQKRSGGRIQAQLADFGIGQVTDKKRLAEAGITALGISGRSRGESTSSQSGTPLYMAPELLEGRAPTLQADIYALGVVLYQVAAGDFRRVLAQGWKRDIGDELLAEDIAAFVDGSPERRPPSAVDVAQRLRSLETRREEHRAAELERRSREASRRRRAIYRAVAVTASMALVLVSVLAVWALNAGREERRARETTERVLDFMVDLFEITDPFSSEQPGEKRGQTITARELLDRGAERVEAELDAEPLVQARLMSTYGKIYLSLGLFEKAQSLLERALAVREDRLGARHPDTLTTRHDLSRAFHEKGDYARSKEIAEQVLEGRRWALGSEHPDTLLAMGTLAYGHAALGEYEEAERLRHQTLEAQERVLGAEHPDTLATMGSLANSLSALGKHGEAKQLYEQTLELRTRMLGSEHPDTLWTMGNLANSYFALGEYAEAQRLGEQALQVRTRVLGPEHPDTLWTLGLLANTHSNLGEYAEAEQLNTRNLEVRTRVLGPEHPDTLWAMGNLANSHADLGEYAEAERLRRQTLELRTRLLGAGHPYTLLTMRNLADDLMHLGNYPQARELLEQSLGAMEQALGPAHELVLYSRSGLAMVMARQGELKEAERIQADVLSTAKKTFGDENRHAMDAIGNLGEIVWRGGEWARAKPILEQALAIHQKVLVPDFPSTQKIKTHLAGALWKLGDVERAKELAGAAWELLEAKLGPQHVLTTLAAHRLLEIARDEQDSVAARQWLGRLQWLAETPEQDIVSADQREIRRMVLEAAESEVLE